MHQVWRQRWINIGWVALGAISIVLLGAGIYKKNHKTCTGIEVSFEGEGTNFFIDEKGVIGLLKNQGVTEGIEIDKINLRQLESILENDNWIANAEIYFDNKQVLKVHVQEKQPVARLFTPDGSSFYIDSFCNRLPLSQKLSARIPMFTGFPSDRTVLSKPDSMLLASAKDVAIFIQNDEFWKAQVAQVDITPNGFEIVPTVGNHVISIGKDGNYQNKFDRLYSFYKQVWTKAGFEAYEKLDVRFEGQVVATIKGASTRSVIDSAKAINVMNKLIEDSKPDTVAESNSKNVEEKDSISSGISVKGKPVAIMPRKIETKDRKVSEKMEVKTNNTLSDEEKQIRNEALMHEDKANNQPKVKSLQEKVKNKSNTTVIKPNKSKNSTIIKTH